MKHTKGPWNIGDEYQGLTNIKSDNFTICKLVLVKDSTSEANARLISAAPEMLEMLELILSIAGESYRSKQELQDAISGYAARAINKAKGN